jgi:quinol monooxygenase YgiN
LELQVDELIIAGWMDYAENRDAVLSYLQVVMKASLNEPGCLAYSMSADPTDPGRIRVFEHWRSKADLDAHMATPHVAEFRAAITGMTRVDRSLHRFVVTDVQVH